MGSPSYEQEPAALAPTAGGSPMGRYGPQVSITHFDTAPRELEWQLPLDGELYRLIPGPDRPDYSLLVLERPLHFYPGAGFDLERVEPEQRVEDRKGRPMVRVHALLVCSRYVGQQLHPGMHDLAVNIAYVIDNSLARDEVVDFGKIEVAAKGFVSEGHAEGAAHGADGAHGAGVDGADGVDRADGADGADGVDRADGVKAAEETEETAGSVHDVVAEAARVLRDGVAAHRGRPVDRLAATLVVGPDHRLAGLSGNADGEAPVPAPETFEQVNRVLARLAEDSASAPEAAPPVGEAGRGEAGSRRFTVQLEGDLVIVEENARDSA